MSKPINTGAFACALICLMITFLAAGFAACAVPNAPTTVLARLLSADDLSAFSKDQLVYAAEVTKDYTVGSHNEKALYEMMWDINEQINAAGLTEPLDRLDTSHGKQALDDASLRDALFEKAGEQYVLDAAAISHLDDVYRVVAAVRIPLVVIALLALASAAHVGVRMGRKALGTLLVASGAIMLAVFAIVGIAAAVDFDAFFAFFHSLFFTEGTWTFWYKSLLICMYPEGFWVGMGVLWLATTALLSILSCCIGLRLRKRKNTHRRAKAAL